MTRDCALDRYSTAMSLRRPAVAISPRTSSSSHCASWPSSSGLVDADRLAFAGIGPQILAQTLRLCAMSVLAHAQDVAVRTVVLLELDQVARPGTRARRPPCCRRWRRETRRCSGRRRRPRTPRCRRREQLEPAVLQAVGVLELVDQDVTEAPLVVLAQRAGCASAIHGCAAAVRRNRPRPRAGTARRRRDRARRSAGCSRRTPRPRRAQPFFLGAVDEVLHVARREALVVDIERLQQPLDRGELVLRIEDLEQSAGRPASR